MDATAAQTLNFTVTGGLSTGAVHVWSTNLNSSNAADQFRHATDITPSGGQANQQWNLNADGTVTGAQSGLCLDASGAGTANSTPVILWSCTGGNNQKWSRS
jgi:hypothetical protein